MQSSARLAAFGERPQDEGECTGDQGASRQIQRPAQGSDRRHQRKVTGKNHHRPAAVRRAQSAPSGGPGETRAQPTRRIGQRGDERAKRVVPYPVTEVAHHDGLHDEIHGGGENGCADDTPGNRPSSRHR